MTTRETNVHTEHCCKDHGCKYGSDACPVEKGTLPQSFPCEACEDVPELATRQSVINELSAIRDGQRGHAKAKALELAQRATESATATRQMHALGTWYVEQAWSAQAVAHVWGSVDYRMKENGLDMVDAVRRVRRTALRELLSSRELKRDVTSVYTQHARDEALRQFLRETRHLVTKALGLPDVSLDDLV